MDEYVGIPEAHPESYHYFMHSNLFSHVDMKPENINILDGNAKDLEKECEEYEAKIKAVGGIDLFLGGIGPDGHIAFNIQGSEFDTVTRKVILNEKSKKAITTSFNIFNYARL